MKKAKILLMLFAALLILSANAFATTLSMPDLTGDVGAVVDIPVNIDDATGVAAFQVKVTYNSAVLNCTDVLKGSLISTGWDAMTKNVQSGQIFGSTNSSDLSELSGGSGDLALIRCTVLNNPGGSTTLHFLPYTDTALVNGVGDPIAATLDDGSFTINGGCTDNDSDTYSPDGGDCGPVDCNDSDPAVHPGATEVCNNVDDDCDFFVDEDLTRPTTCGVGACASTGIETCTSGVWGGDTCTPGTEGTETCNNIDDDCDGTVDDGIASTPTSCGTGVCARTGTLACVGGSMVDSCTPGSATGTDNNCNNRDENCNGTVDENYVPTDVTCGIGACQSTGQMICDMANHYIVSTCVAGQPGTEGPAGDATCGDAIDNDCDSATDGADMSCVAPKTVSVPDMNTIPNVAVTIPVSIDDAEGIAGFQFTVTYDSAVLNCTGVTDGDLTSGWELTFNPTSGRIVALANDPELDELPIGSGVLANLQCNAVGAAGSSTALNIVDSSLVDGLGNVIPGAATAGSLTIVSCIPTGPEVCDGADNDCNGQTDEGIASVMLRTTCGEGACKRPAYRECISGSLVDTCTAGNAVAETCNNLDDDCDGQVDDGVTRQTNCGIGGCARTGIETCTAGVWGGNTCSAGAPSQETCNSVDDDCDGVADESVASVRTTCGQGACVARGMATCQGGVMVDSCTPRPAGTETCNRIDDDCDGQVDEDLTTATSCGVGACLRAGQQTCTNGQLVNSCTPGAPSQEICDGSDNDCDGSTDESIAAVRITCGTGICKRAGLRTCVSGSLTDNCTPGTPGIEGPTGGATCSDNLDNDCDSAIDAADTNCQ